MRSMIALFVEDINSELVERVQIRTSASMTTVGAFTFVTTHTVDTRAAVTKAFSFTATDRTALVSVRYTNNVAKEFVCSCVLDLDLHIRT